MTGVEEGVAIGSLVAAGVGAGASVYAASQAGKMPNAPKAPIDPLLPKDDPASSALQKGDDMAKSAGGTLLSKTGGLGEAATTTRKSLLGT